MEKIKFLTLPGLELRPCDRPARSQFSCTTKLLNVSLMIIIMVGRWEQLITKGEPMEEIGTEVEIWRPVQ
jgi:hypothetical protein